MAQVHVQCVMGGAETGHLSISLPASLGYFCLECVDRRNAKLSLLQGTQGVIYIEEVQLMGFHFQLMKQLHFQVFSRTNNFQK